MTSAAGQMKILLKRAALFFCALLTSPLAALVHLGDIFGAEAPFAASAQGLSLVPGLWGNYLRLGFYRLTLKQISPDVSISFGTFFSKRSVTVGRNVSIGAYCIMGQVKLEDGVMIASRVSLLSGKYQHGSALAPGPPVQSAGGIRFETIVIGRGTWIGEGAVVAANVGRDCIVAAGAVVTRDVPDSYMAAGNPVKMVRIARQTASQQSPVYGSPPASPKDPPERAGSA